MKRAFLLFLLVAIPCCGQQKNCFDAAVVRSAHGVAEEGFWSPPGIGRFDAHHVTLERLMILAYGVNSEQIANKPAWMTSELYDVDAKPDSDVLLSREELKPCLQALLEERFHLVVHTEERLTPGYALIVAKNGVRLHSSQGAPYANFRVRVSKSELSGKNWSMAFLATQLQAVTGRPVVDKTGLQGGYDLKVEFAPEIAADAQLPPLYTALEETLGLKLKPAKVPVPFVVIDSVMRKPEEN